MAQLSGKTAIVTGGRQGIGRAIVDGLVKSGARVLTCGRSPRPRELPDAVLWQQADMASRNDVEALKQVAGDAFGHVDILVNNAGIQIE